MWACCVRKQVLDGKVDSGQCKACVPAKGNSVAGSRSACGQAARLPLFQLQLPVQNSTTSVPSGVRDLITSRQAAGEPATRTAVVVQREARAGL